MPRPPKTKAEKKSQPERLQKVLANAGLGSRREIEGWIKAGRLQVNDKIAELGIKVSDRDQITLDGRPVGQKRTQVDRHLILYNKPEGQIVTRKDEEDRDMVFDHLPKLKQGRWVSVGRLDINSAGLLLLTTDGELANRLMHPSQQIEREYAVRVHGSVLDEDIRQLVTGVQLEDGMARFEDVVSAGGEASNQWFHVVIMEGRKREVRRLWEAIGVKVSRLKRVRFGPIFLDSSVKLGRWRELSKEERRSLLDLVGLKDNRPWGTLEAGKKRPGRSVWNRGGSGPATAGRTARKKIRRP